MFGILFLIASFVYMEKANEAARLRVRGNKIYVGNSDKTLRARGVNLSWNNWWHQFYNAATVQRLKSEWHVNIIRAAIGVEQDGGFYQNETGSYNDLYAVIDACIANQIYVIVDWQTFSVKHLPNATKFFTQVANKYHSSPYIIYDLLNEPDDSNTWAQIKSYSESLIKTIRAIDSSNLIIVGTPIWDQHVKEAAADPVTGDNNIIYSIHIYVGTHPLSYIDDAKEALKTIGLIGGEIGAMNADGNGTLSVDKFNQWINFYEENKISWLCWGVQSKPNETCSLLKPSESWSDLTEWGNLCKSTITKYQ